MDDEAHGKAQEAVDLAHPLRVALGKIIVDGDDVNALAGQRVEVRGQDGDERLAFAGLHFGDAALMQHDAADDLHAVRAHAEHAAQPPRGMVANASGSRSSSVSPPARRVFEFLRLGTQLVVRELFIRLFERHDLVDRGG